MSILCRFAVVFLLYFTAGSVARAQTCPPYTFSFTNGTTADATQVMGNFNAVLNCLNGLANGGTLANPSFIGTTTTQQLKFADGTTQVSAAMVNSTVRQTVLTGPVDANGLPNFLPSNTGGLTTLSTVNISAAAPLIVTAANNFSGTGFGPVNQSGGTTTNLVWTNLAANATNYLYVTVSATGGLTTGLTVLQPLYQYAGTPSGTSGQFTFNYGPMTGFLGNGGAAAQTYTVFVGEAVTNASAVTSTVAYAYNRFYESGWTNTLPGTNAIVLKPHNLGVQPGRKIVVAECITADMGFSVGEQISTDGGLVGYFPSAPYDVPAVLASTRNSVRLIMPPGTTFAVLNGAASGAYQYLTAANWKYKFIVAGAF